MKRILVFLLLITMFAFPTAALADMAPPYNPPAAVIHGGLEK